MAEKKWPDKLWVFRTISGYRVTEEAPEPEYTDDEVPYVPEAIAEERARKARAETWEAAAKECPPGEWGLNMCRHFMAKAAREKEGKEEKC